MASQTKWKQSREEIFNDLENRCPNIPVIDNPEPVKVDASQIELQDPRVIECQELISEYDPSKLLSAYCESQRKHKVKFEKSVTQENSHMCKCRFYTRDRTMVSSATHPTKIYNATQYSAQKMLLQIFPHASSWLHCVEIVKDAISSSTQQADSVQEVPDVDSEIMVIN